LRYFPIRRILLLDLTGQTGGNVKRPIPVILIVLIGLALGLPAQSLVITAPNGGETLTLGQTVQITWAANNINQKVKLQLIRGGGSLVGLIAGNLNATPSSFTWTIGQTDSGTAAADTNYKIRIRTADNALEDASNATFTLAAASTPPPPPPPSSFTSPYQRKTPELQKNPGPDFSLPANAVFTVVTVNGRSAESTSGNEIQCHPATDIVIQAGASSAVQPVLYQYRMFLYNTQAQALRQIYLQPWTEQNHLTINLSNQIIYQLLYPDGFPGGTLPMYYIGHIFVEVKNATQSEQPQGKQFDIRWYL
jgi:hypothetical protein